MKARCELPDPFEWQLLSPHQCGRVATQSHSVTPQLLRELSEFRGRVLHADGRRPAFAHDGGFADDSLQDVNSYHVTVRQKEELVACVRITPYRNDALGTIGELGGITWLHEVIARMGLVASECIEGARWIVAPSVRGSTVGRLLLVSLWAVGRWLGKRCLYGAVGTRDGQDKMIERAGGMLAPGTTLLAAEQYDDELAIMYFDLWAPPPSVAASIPTVASCLNIEEPAISRSWSCDRGDQAHTSAPGDIPAVLPQIHMEGS